MFSRPDQAFDGKKFEKKIFSRIVVGSPWIYHHHTYENRFRSMQRELHELDQEIFNQSETGEVQMIVGNRNRRNTAHELVRKRPQKWLLRNQPPKSESS